MCLFLSYSGSYLLYGLPVILVCHSLLSLFFFFIVPFYELICLINIRKYSLYHIYENIVFIFVGYFVGPSLLVKDLLRPLLLFFMKREKKAERRINVKLSR